MKAYWHQEKNVGDTLTPVILKHFTDQPIEFVPKSYCGKVVAVGSIMSAVKDEDVVWGTGSISKRKYNIPDSVDFLAVRGPLTRELIGEDRVPAIYGDPGILISDVYYPMINKAYRYGVMPHYVDKDNQEMLEFCKKENALFIDVANDWKTIVEQILSCEIIISSSLHGIVMAESYVIPAVWIKLSDKIVGGDFKFQDYFLGTERRRQEPSDFKQLRWLPKIYGLDRHKNNLIEILERNLDNIIEGEDL